MAKKQITRVFVASVCVSLFGGIAGSMTGCVNLHRHDWNDWTTVTSTTCSADGEETRACKSDPNHKETRKIDKNDNHIVASWSIIEDGVAKGKQHGRCETCGHDVMRASGENAFKSVLSTSKNRLVSDDANHKLTIGALVKLNDADAYKVDISGAIDKDNLGYSFELKNFIMEDGDVLQSGVMKYKDFDGFPGIVMENGYDFSIFSELFGNSIEISKTAIDLLLGKDSLKNMGSLSSLNGLFFGEIESWYSILSQKDDTFTLDKTGLSKLVEIKINQIDGDFIDNMLKNAIPENGLANVMKELTELGILKDGKFSKEGTIKLAKGMIETVVVKFNLSFTIKDNLISGIVIDASLDIPAKFLGGNKKPNVGHIGTDVISSNDEQKGEQESLKIDVNASIGIEYGGQSVDFVRLAPLQTPVITKDAKTITWERIDGAQWYSIEIMHNGSRVGYYANGNSYDLSGVMRGGGDYSVRVRAVPNFDENKIDGVSDRSNTVTYTLTALPTPTNVIISGGVFSWDVVDDASKYYVSISYDNGSYNFEVNSNSCTLPSGAKRAGIHSVSVCAIPANDDMLNGNSEWSRPCTYTLEALPTPINVVLNNSGVLSWNAIEGVARYEIGITRCGEEKSFSRFVENSNTANLKQYNINDAGDYIVSVRAVPAEADFRAFSEWGGDVSFSKEAISIPTNVKLTNGVFSWDAVEGADGYRVEILKESKFGFIYCDDFTERSTSCTVPSWSKDVGNYIIHVRVIPNDSDFTKGYSDWSEGISYTLTAITTPTNVKITDGILSWDAVEGLDGYRVEILKERGKGDYVYYGEYFEESNSYTISSWARYFGAGNYIIHVRAIPDDSDFTKGYSDWSEDVPYTLTAMATPTNVKLTNGILSWDAVEGADKYEIEIFIGFNGEYHNIYGSFATSTSYIVPSRFKDADNYLVHVRAIPAESDFTKGYSEWSENVEILSTVK